MRSGIIMLTLGICVAVLGYGAFINRSYVCYVFGFQPAPPCTIRYQVALLAPLYPLSLWLIEVGLVLAINGAVLTIVGYSRGTGTV